MRIKTELLPRGTCSVLSFRPLLRCLVPFVFSFKFAISSSQLIYSTYSFAGWVYLSPISNNNVPSYVSSKKQGTEDNYIYMRKIIKIKCSDRIFSAKLFSLFMFNSSICTMALGSAQLLTKMRIKILPRR